MSADDFVFSTLIAKHPDPATASRALQLAEAAVLRRAADAISGLPQDYECDPGRGDAVERLRRTAEGIEEKASATAPTATPELLPKADVVAWLTKKARELRSAGGPVRAAQADAVAALASKVDRGAIRPDNLRMLPADFFEPGHTYSDTDPGIDWKFRVDHITTHPGNGELAALGWRHFKGDWQPIAHFADDWELHQHVGHTAVEKSSREAIATPQVDAPLAVRWDRTVIHPEADPADDTIVCCLDAKGRPVALFLDDEHREALGLLLVDPTGEGEPQLTGRLAQLLDAIRTQGGEWTTRKGLAIYRALGDRAPLRMTVRKDLHALHAMGHLVMHEERGRRYFTLNTRNGSAR